MDNPDWAPIVKLGYKTNLETSGGRYESDFQIAFESVAQRTTVKVMAERYYKASAELVQRLMVFCQFYSQKHPENHKEAFDHFFLSISLLMTASSSRV